MCEYIVREDFLVEKFTILSYKILLLVRFFKQRGGVGSSDFEQIRHS